MKIKLLVVAAALLGAASLPAHAGVRFGFNVGLPLPLPVPVPVFADPPVVACPAPVYGCAYAPGYWGGGYGRVWTGGGWHYGPGRGYGYGHYYGRYHR